MRGEDLSRYSNKIIESLGSRKCRSMIVVRVSVGDAADLHSPREPSMPVGLDTKQN